MLPPSLPPQAGWLHQCEGRPPPTHTHSSLSAYFVINRLQHAATAAASIYSTQAAIFPTALVMPAQRYHRVVRRTSRKTVVPVSHKISREIKERQERLESPPTVLWLFWLCRELNRVYSGNWGCSISHSASQSSCHLGYALRTFHHRC